MWSGTSSQWRGSATDHVDVAVAVAVVDVAVDVIDIFDGVVGSCCSQRCR